MPVPLRGAAPRKGGDICWLPSSAERRKDCRPQSTTPDGLQPPESQLEAEKPGGSHFTHKSQPHGFGKKTQSGLRWNIGLSIGVDAGRIATPCHQGVSALKESGRIAV